MRGENFIFFLASCGFFIGVIFSILKELDFEEFLYATFLLTAIFYLIGIASVSLFIKYLNIKRIVYFDKHQIDSIIDIQIKELEKKEDFILESYEFIKKIEEEELKLLKKRS